MSLTRRTMIKGSLGLTGAAALSAGPLRFRNAAALQETPKKIEYWHRLAGDSAAAVESLAQKFNQEYAGLIEVTSIPQGDIAQLTQKVRAAAAGGGLPGALMADDADVLAVEGLHLLAHGIRTGMIFQQPPIELRRRDRAYDALSGGDPFAV